ncbi:Response regulator receiver domain-containing protein [Desulfonatronum thiosulfatophilum]|uniref:Response regulator receiver domain-containing protein n=1 Tax=Desulfonatronum thiosulfatophilum TaxID=617002 RepID=A0A1G6CY40_9BACT|nr:response regulator [Desulfonatronum thiosulfatophilum]SDB37857.1 Response regulator receiver domain-containing protein [Desulfonatronum thiosulfatophilum]
MAKKILIVDDDPEILDYLSELFQDSGYKTVTAINGVEGLEKVRAEQPDLITLDMDMPEKGGTNFYAGLRKDQANRDIPVIVVSGVGPRPPVLTKDVPTISKPIDNAKLMQLVSDMIP